MSQRDLFALTQRDDGAPPTLPHADGVTYSAALDRLRLATVLGSVYRALASGGRWTLWELQAHCEREIGKPVSVTSVSAKIRDLRKTACGGLDVRSERVSGGTWTYYLAGGER